MTSSIEALPLKQIIREAVHTYANELYENIVINDLEDYGLELLEYRGDTPLFFFFYKGICENMTYNKDMYCMNDNWSEPKKLSDLNLSNKEIDSLVEGFRDDTLEVYLVNVNIDEETGEITIIEDDKEKKLYMEMFSDCLMPYKVYANSNNQLLSYADKVEATKLASCSGNVTNKNLYGTNNAGANLSQEILSNSDNHDCYGYYKWSDGEIIWIPGSPEAYWAQYARFYFLNSNVAAETIAHDEASIDKDGSGRQKKNNEIWYYKASKKSSLQHKDGFKIASKYKGGTTSGRVTCDWNCSFIGCNAGDKLNSGDVKDTYNDDSET